MRQSETGWSKFKRGSIAAILLSGTSLVAFPLITVALVPSAAQAQTAPVAFSIRPQSLDGALAAFGAASGVQVLYDAGVTNGVQSPGVNGSLAPQDALNRLLSGTGFGPVYTGPKSVTIQKLAAANSGSTTLAPLVIQGQARTESPVGPVEGIVATRSATATKTNAALIETPQSVSVVTRDAMTAQGARTVDAATRYTSGIRSERFGTDTRHDWFAIRGIHSTADGGFLDGHSLFATGYAGARIEAYGLERVEVVKGPNSVMYGGAPAGGFVNMISKRPSTETQREVETGFDNFGQYYAAGDVTGSIDPDGKWSYRLTALGRGGELYGDNSGDERIFIAPALTWRPDEDTSLTILTSYQRDHTGPKLQPTFLPYEGTVVPIPGYGYLDRDFNFGEDWDRFDRNQLMLGYEFEHKLNDWLTLRQNTKYTYLDVQYGLTYSMPVPIAGPTFSRLWGLSQPTSNLFSIDNSAIAKASTGPVDHTILAGFDYKYYRTDNNDRFAFVNPLNVSNPVYGGTPPSALPYNDNTQLMNSYGVYVQDEMKLDNWFLTLSGRHDWVKTEQVAHIPGNLDLDRNDSSFSGRAALLYKFDFGLSPYVSYSTFFAPTVGISGAGTLYKPEEGRQYEVGVKFQPEGKNSMITAAVFDIVRQNVISTGTGIFAGTQLDEVRSRGFEVEALANITDGLNLRGSFTAHELEITKGGYKGNRPTSAPEMYASAWADYTFQSGDLRGLGFGGGVRYVGNSPANDANTRYVPDYTIADATIFYDIEGWRLGLNISNLFDKRYVSACTGTTTNAEYCYWGESRRAMLNASYKW